jgi:hypothetical protein
MRDDAGRGLAGHRHRGVRQGGHLGRSSEEILDTVVATEVRLSYPLAPAWPAGLDAVSALDDIGLEGDGSRPAVKLQK